MVAPPDHAADSLARAAVAALSEARPSDKARLAHAMAAAWRSGEIGDADPPGRPARPPRPRLRAPRDMPRRGKAGSRTGRIALLHALAHIELNAVDLACDIIARFTGAGLPRRLHDDWITVADEEARHFELLCGRLAAHDAAYGDLPAHDGLWQAAEETGGDILARLAVVPLVLEARGARATRQAPRFSTSSIATRSAMSRSECDGSSMSASHAASRPSPPITSWLANIIAAG